MSTAGAHADLSVWWFLGYWCELTDYSVRTVARGRALCTFLPSLLGRKDKHKPFTSVWWWKCCRQNHQGVTTSFRFQGNQSWKDSEFQEPVPPDAVASFGLLDKLKRLQSKLQSKKASSSLEGQPSGREDLEQSSPSVTFYLSSDYSKKKKKNIMKLRIRAPSFLFTSWVNLSTSLKLFVVPTLGRITVTPRIVCHIGLKELSSLDEIAQPDTFNKRTD